MARFDEFLRKKFDRRRFLQFSGLAALAGGHAAWARPAHAAETISSVRTTRAPVRVPPNAQYGRARGRYPAAKRI